MAAQALSISTFEPLDAPPAGPVAIVRFEPLGRPAPVQVEGFTDSASVRVTNPPPPTPTITRGRFTGLPGRNVTSATPSPLTELITEGAMQTGRGVASFARQALYPQGMDAAFDAGSDVLEGAMQMAIPLVIGGFIAELPATLFALGVGYVASKAGGKVADLVGLSPAATRFVENFAGAVAASGLTLRRLNQLGLKAAGKIAEKATEARAAREVQAPAEYIDVTPRQLEADNAPPARPASAGPATRPAPAPLTIATIEPLLVDAEGRVLGGDAGPERRVVAQGLPTGVEERRLLPAAPVREDFRTNPDLVKQAKAMQGQADEARVTAPLTIATVEPLEEEALRAVQEPSRKALDVRQQTGDGEAVGRGDAKYPRPAGARAPQGQEAVIAEAEGPLATLSDEQLHAIVDHPESHEEVAHEAIAELMVRKEQADVQPTLPEQATTMAKEPWAVRSPAVEWDALDRDTRREVRRIQAELENFPFVKKSFTETLHRGGDLEVVAGAGGAPVYWDIVGGTPERARPVFRYTRSQVLDKLRAFSEDGTRSVISDLAVDVAQRRLLGDQSLQQAWLPPQAGDAPGAVSVRRLTTLDADRATVQERAARAVEDDPAGMVGQYRAHFDNVVNADKAKELFPEYAASNASRTQNDLAVHRPASRLAQAAYDTIIDEPVPEGRAAMAVFTAGGTGSGKSSALDAVLPGVRARAHVVYDSALTDLDAALYNIRRARETRHEVLVVFSDRDVGEAFHATIERARESGRPVTISTHVATHVKAPQVLQGLRAAFTDDPDVTFIVVTNSTAGGRALVSVDEWLGRDYNEGDVRSRVEAIVDAEQRAGHVSPDLAAALRPRARQSGPGVPADHAARSAPVLRDASSGRPVEDTRPTRRVGSPSGGGREGMAGLFSEAEPATTGRAETIRPIEFPELVGLARELASTPGVIKRFRSEGKRGEFRGDTGTIRLASDLFTAGQEQQLAATLAHEIGHLVDWLPHRTLKRGNILGRLFSLRSFLKHTFIAPDGSHITNKEIKAELMALSNKWRPWDPATVSPSFAAYRKSAKENFADAMSVLLNNPSLLEKDAPIFYEQFFTALDQKPEVKRAYFDLQELLAGSPEELVARRRAGVQEMFTLGDTKAMDLERLRQAERRMTVRDLWLRMRSQHVDKNTPLIDRVKQLEARGVRINPDDDPRYFLEERNYLGGKLKAFTEQHFLPIYTTLSEHAIDWHTFGEPLLYERIIAGDRSELANPRGIAPAVASDLRNDLLRSLNPEQRRVIRENITAFRTVLNGVAEDAHQAGLYTDDLHTQMQENPAWVSFRVIEHIESNVTSRVYRQVGTLKDITNPADASMLKTLVTLRAIEHQRVKVACFDFLTQYYPADIEQAKEIGSPKGRRPIDPEDQKKQQLVTYYEHGHLRGKYVDPYIADSLINASVGQNWAIISGLRFVNSTLFRPLFTTLNLGFQTSNFARDFLRSWKNQPTMTFARLAQRYLQAVPLARVRAFGLPAHPNAQQRLAHKELLEAQQTALLSVTFNDLIAGREIADTQIEDTLARMGIGGFGSTAPKSQILRPVRAVLDWIRKTGDFIETLPKAAAIYEYRGAGTIAEIPADIRSRIRRTIGSPDFLAGGTYKPITNEVLLFSNAIVQALRSDLDVATAPATRTGFWWKTAKLNILPKLLAFAVLFGLAVSDDDEADDSPVMTKWREIRRAWRGISEYDMTNYLSIPLGLDEKGNAVYVRLPQDDAGRLIGGLTWKLLRAFRGDREVLDVAMGVLDYTAGQGPSLTPTLQVGTNVAQFAAGRNVYDPFRSRFLFTEDELKAGGWRAAQKFVGYEFQQLGGGILWRFSPGATRPREQTTGQRILDLPVLSNIVGRWIRISNYGEIEHLRETEQKVQQGEARGRLAEREAVMEALRSYLKLPAAERTMGKQQALAHGIVDHLYADKAPRDRAEEYRDVLKKIRMGIQRGGADALTDTVLSATSTAQKVAVLLAAAESMGRAKFSEWMFRATQEQVISSAVRAEVNRALAKPAPAAR